MSLKEFLGLVDMAKECNVHGCDKTEDIGIVVLKPFDPIDHSSKTVTLCPNHQEWAEERNAFAELIAEELREKRRELGNEYIEDIERLETPEDTE